MSLATDPFSCLGPSDASHNLPGVVQADGPERLLSGNVLACTFERRARELDSGVAVVGLSPWAATNSC